METKNFLGLEGLKHFWTKAKTWIVNEITTKIAEIVAEAPEDLNTLKEISDWISTHEDSASAMNSNIIKNQSDINELNNKLSSIELLKVGANTITLRDGNPTALGNTELAGVVTENYDGNNHNNIISIDKNGVARTGDIDIATRILYSNNETNFFTDEGLTIPATIGTDENVRDTGNQTSGGVKIYEGVTYSNNDTQALATREDNPKDGAFMKWDAASKKLVSGLAIPDPSLDGTVLTASVGQDNNVTVEWQPLIQPVDAVTSGDMRPVTSNAVNNALTGVMKENSVIHPTWIDVTSNNNFSGMGCFLYGVDYGSVYAWQNPNDSNDKCLTIWSKVGNVILMTAAGYNAYLNGQPIATIHKEEFFTGGLFTTAKFSQNILSVTDIEITRAGFYDIDMDFVTHGLEDGKYIWNYCSVFFMNKSTGNIIGGHDLNMQRPFMYDSKAGVPIHNSSHGIKYLEPGHYGVRADTNEAGTYEAYLWIHGRS